MNPAFRKRRRAVVKMRHLVVLYTRVGLLIVIS
jgi:hypothetical protein